MTIDRETVIRLAKEAGGDPEHTPWGDIYAFEPAELERFAKLVLEHERKPLCWLQQDKFGNFHVADESWHGAFPVYVDKENT